MDRGAAEEKYDDDEKNDAEKEAECLVLTPPVYMEEGFGKKIDKNDRIDEEIREGEKTDSVSTKVNDEEWTDLTPSVDMEEGVGKRKDDKNDRIAEEKHDIDEKKR